MLSPSTTSPACSPALVMPKQSVFRLLFSEQWLLMSLPFPRKCSVTASRNEDHSLVLDFSSRSSTSSFGQVAHFFHFFFACKNTNVIAFTKVWCQTDMLHSFHGHPVLMISVVLISSLLFSLLLLASHISLSSNNSDTWLLLFSLYLLLTFKYCLSCCNLKPVPYKSIPQCYYYITPLWTLFLLLFLLLIKCCEENTVFQVAFWQSCMPSGITGTWKSHWMWDRHLMKIRGLLQTLVSRGSCINEYVE